MIWVYIGLAVVLGVVIALAVVAAGRESNERGGMLALDTARAWRALRKCDPVHGVHYFGNGVDRPCQCGSEQVHPWWVP